MYLSSSKTYLHYSARLHITQLFQKQLNQLAKITYFFLCFSSHNKLFETLCVIHCTLRGRQKIDLCMLNVQWTLRSNPPPPPFLTSPQYVQVLNDSQNWNILIIVTFLYLEACFYLQNQEIKIENILQIYRE